mgnify:CR=1 FL=1
MFTHGCFPDAENEMLPGPDVPEGLPGLPELPAGLPGLRFSISRTFPQIQRK